MCIALTMDYTPIQLQRVNCVRIYLGVFYVNEIITPEGDEISQGILQSQKHQEYHTTMSRPYQKLPNTRSWTLLAKLITFITHDGVILKTKLGTYTMINTEEPLYKMVEHHKGGWLGFAKFDISEINNLTGNVKQISLKPLLDSPLAGKNFAFTAGQYLSL